MSLVGGLLGGVGGLAGGLLGSPNQNDQSSDNGRNQAADAETKEPSETPEEATTSAGNNGVIQVSVPNLLPTILSLADLLSSNSPTPAATIAPTAAASVDQTTTSTPQSTPTETSQSSLAAETTAPPTETAATSLVPLLTGSTTTFETTPVPTLESSGLPSAPVEGAAVAQNQNSMDPGQNPTMLALIITIPIATLVLVGVTIVLWKGGCLRCGKFKKRAIIKDEIEHEAWVKVHEEKFGPSKNY